MAFGKTCPGTCSKLARVAQKPCASSLGFHELDSTCFACSQCEQQVEKHRTTKPDRRVSGHQWVFWQLGRKAG
eukprot:5118081-Amphidinium_carterae.1